MIDSALIRLPMWQLGAALVAAIFVAFFSTSVAIGIICSGLTVGVASAFAITTFLLLQAAAHYCGAAPFGLIPLLGAEAVRVLVVVGGTALLFLSERINALGVVLGLIITVLGYFPALATQKYSNGKL